VPGGPVVLGKVRHASLTVRKAVRFYAVYLSYPEVDCAPGYAFGACLEKAADELFTVKTRQDDPTYRLLWELEADLPSYAGGAVGGFKCVSLWSVTEEFVEKFMIIVSMIYSRANQLYQERHGTWTKEDWREYMERPELVTAAALSLVPPTDCHHLPPEAERHPFVFVRRRRRGAQRRRSGPGPGGPRAPLLAEFDARIRPGTADPSSSGPGLGVGDALFRFRRVRIPGILCYFSSSSRQALTSLTRGIALILCAILRSRRSKALLMRETSFGLNSLTGFSGLGGEPPFWPLAKI
jgi:hypothetical protein